MTFFRVTIGNVNYSKRQTKTIKKR